MPTTTKQGEVHEEVIQWLVRKVLEEITADDNQATAEINSLKKEG